MKLKLRREIAVFLRHKCARLKQLQTITSMDMLARFSELADARVKVEGASILASEQRMTHDGIVVAVVEFSIECTDESVTVVIQPKEMATLLVDLRHGVQLAYSCDDLMSATQPPDAPSNALAAEAG